MRTWLTLLWLTLGCALGELSSIAWPDHDTELPLWTPEAAPSETWPAIVYYHGTNGRPNIRLMRDATEGKGFVIVGMTYLNKGRFEQNEANIAAELSQLNKLKRTLIDTHAVDPARIYVAGFSKGGWFSATLLERDHSLAGGLILGAGVFHSKRPGTEPKPKPKRFLTKKPIFVGVGRFDGNYPQSLAALLHFRKLGAEVTLEAWPDTEHAYPKQPAVSMQQWLQLEGGATKRVALSWIANRRRAIESISDPVEQWYALKAFEDRPFVKVHGIHLKNQLEVQLKALTKDPKVSAEQGFVETSQGILKRELKDRFVTTIEEALTRYEALAKKGTGTRAGEIAEKDAARVRQLLGRE